MQGSARPVLLLISLVAIAFFYVQLYWKGFIQFRQEVLPSMTNGKDMSADPWDGIPEVAIYLRFTSSIRWEGEYNNVVLRTMKMFLPQNKLKLLLVLDDEKLVDHEMGERLSKKWPYPDICYRQAGDPKVYRHLQKARMFWDMMYPDYCTNLPYVGFIDTDTFFDTLMTPNLLFENGKPVIVAKVGVAAYSCWSDTTATFLRKKEVMQCMSNFPVMMKTAHLKEMREVLAREQGKDFDIIFMNSVSGIFFQSMIAFKMF